jgi:catechol 2,3-dioxygenase
MSTQGKTSIITSSVKLNVQHLEPLTNFYVNSIGLKLLEEKEGYSALGTPDGKILLELEQTDAAPNEDTTGIYHFALLLPTQKDLGTILRHLILSQVPVSGASNHGYSNAIYLNDPEGNGIEIYADKPKSEWDIREDGSIAGITVAMDVDAALEAAETSFESIPNGTTMGHVHLHVDELENSLEFYTEVLGLGLKYKFGPAALFLASGDYHHHLGANVWKDGQLTHPKDDTPGLAYTTWEGTKEDLAYIEKQLNERDLPYNKADDELFVKDSAGLTHHIVEK